MPTLVHADGQHVRVGLEDVLHPVAVMHIDIHVRDAMPAPLEPLARDGGVVVRAETRRAVAVRVVQTARGAEGVERGATLYRLGGDE